MSEPVSARGGKPVRVQRQRAKGWRMPPNTVSVTRPGPYGNPFVIGEPAPRCYARFHRGIVQDAGQSVTLFRRALAYEMSRPTAAGERVVDLVAALHGKNLACWCPLPAPGEPDCCHAAVLLDLANE